MTTIPTIASEALLGLLLSTAALANEIEDVCAGVSEVAEVVMTARQGRGSRCCARSSAMPINSRASVPTQ